MKINNFRGDLTDISVKKEPLSTTHTPSCQNDLKRICDTPQKWYIVNSSSTSLLSIHPENHSLITRIVFAVRLSAMNESQVTISFPVEWHTQKNKNKYFRGDLSDISANKASLIVISYEYQRSLKPKTTVACLLEN